MSHCDLLKWDFYNPKRPSLTTKGVFSHVETMVCMLLLCCVTTVSAREYSSTGFYYPLKDESPNFSSAGRWLERPPPNGHYVSSGVYHTGSDMMIARDMPVYAISDGEVKSPSTSGWGGIANVAMIIEHRLIDGRTFRAIYGHILAEKSSGSQVKAGERIGKIGPYTCGSNTHCSHLHFGVLSPGLHGSINGDLGRYTDAKYGVQVEGYYDNGLVDPIWFITHNTPDNWLSRAGTNPDDLTKISIVSPWFPELCGGSSVDQRCDASDVDSFTTCDYEQSGICTPDVDSYSAVDGGGNGSGNAGGGGGSDSYNLNQDFDIVNPSSGSELYAGTDRLQVSQVVNLRVQLQSEGGDVRNSIQAGKDTIETDYYVRLDSGSWVFFRREYTKVSNLGSGTHTETVSYTVPQGISEVSFRVRIDAEDEVSEVNEGDNWSRIETFAVINTSLCGNLSASRCVEYSGSACGKAGYTIEKCMALLNVILY